MTNVTSKSKKPTKPQFNQVGRHAEDAMRSVATSMELSLNEVQVGIIINPELQPKLQQFLRELAESHLLATQPHILKRQSFNPKTFLGECWSIDEEVGKRQGNILDASKIVRKDYLNQGEPSINGEERLRRIKANPKDVQLDTDDFLALWEEKDHVTLNWLYETQGITFLSFWGNILWGPRGRCVLYLVRHRGDSWYWYDGWVGNYRWGAGYPSGLLAS